MFQVNKDLKSVVTLKVPMWVDRVKKASSELTAFADAVPDWEFTDETVESKLTNISDAVDVCNMAVAKFREVRIAMKDVEVDVAASKSAKKRQTRFQKGKWFVRYSRMGSNNFVAGLLGQMLASWDFKTSTVKASIDHPEFLTMPDGTDPYVLIQISLF